MSEQEVAFSSIGVSAPGHSSPALVGSRVYGHYRGPFFVRLILKYFLLGHLEAERLYERSRPHEEPPWLSFYTAAELAADLGRCLRDIGESEPAAELIQWAMDRYESWRVRSRCFVQTDLATVHLVGRELERAAAVGHDALSTAADIRSARIVDRIRTLQRQIEPLRSGSIPLAELDEQITDFLTLQSGRQSQDRSL